MWINTRSILYHNVPGGFGFLQRHDRQMVAQSHLDEETGTVALAALHRPSQTSCDYQHENKHHMLLAEIACQPRHTNILEDSDLILPFTRNRMQQFMLQYNFCNYTQYWLQNR